MALREQRGYGRDREKSKEQSSKTMNNRTPEASAARRAGRRARGERKSSCYHTNVRDKDFGVLYDETDSTRYQDSSKH